MNFLTAVRENNDVLRLGPGVTFSLPRITMASCKAQSFIVGIRPENLLLESNTTSLPQNAVVWPSRVQLLESLGGETLIHLALEGQDIRLKLPGSPNCRCNDQVRIGFMPESVHLFSKKEGTCILHGLERQS